MSVWLKALPLALAVAILSISGASCGSSSPAQVRFVDAIQDGAAMDIEVNGTLEFTDVAFLGVQPNQPGHTSVPSGRDTIEGVLTGTTTKAFSSAVSLGAAGQYTLIATGFSQTGTTKGDNVDLLQISDNIPVPPSGDVAFRVVHASPSGPNGAPGAVDVYVLLNPSTGPVGNPTFPAVAYTQTSSYVSIPNNPNNATMPPGFTVYVTPVGSTQPVIREPINLQAGAVRTLVLTDVQGGTKMSSTFLELSDLN